MGDGTGATAADTDDTDGEADRDHIVRRDDIPDDAVILQCGLILGDDGVLGRLHEDDRNIGATNARSQ